MSDPQSQEAKYEALQPFLNERQRRLWAATEARALGRGGITRLSEATGLSRKTVALGLRELKTLGQEEPEIEAPPPEAGGDLAEGMAVLMPGRLRRPGGGRKRLTDTDPTLLSDLEALVEPLTRGDPESPLRWTCKSTPRLAKELQSRGHQVSERKVGYLLEELGYSLQANRKSREGASHPDRNAQFERINAQTEAFQARGQPVISVDTKKKELVGAFKNGGQEWQPLGSPEAVSVHDFPEKTLGKAIPYGIYDVTTNTGWVSVGTDHDTAAFAVQSMESWWEQMGGPAYPEATELLIIADGGGSNGSRSRLWKRELQALADETGLSLSVCHLPPGMSKWNKIEHRMFCHITQNWRGRPLISHEVIVELIGHTSTQGGLRIRAELDRRSYPTGRKVTDEELSRVRIETDEFHGEWNYTIRPAPSSCG